MGDSSISIPFAITLAAAVWSTGVLPGMAGQSSPSPAVAEKSKNTAAKLSGLVRFVDAFCPDLKPNYVRFREVIRILDVDLDQLASGDMLLTSSEYTNAYQKDVTGSCERAREQFGVNGSIIAGLLDAK